MNQFSRKMLLVLTFVFLCGQTSMAGMLWTPSVTVTERYNDNLDLEETDEESDFITRITPNLSIDYDSAWVEGSLNYGFYFLFYMEETDRDETALSDTQRAAVDLLVFPNRDFTITIKDDYSRVRLDSREDDIESNESFNRANRNRFEIRPRYRREFSTFATELDYGVVDERFDDGAGNDSFRHDGGIRFEKAFSPRLTGFTLGRYTDFNAEDSSDYQSVLVGVGATYAFGPGWQASASVEPQWIDFEDEDEETYVGFNSEVRKTAARSESFISYARTQENTNNDDGSFREEDIRFGYTRTGRLEPTFELFYAQNDFFTTDREDEEYGAILNLVYHITSRLDVWGEITGSKLEFKDADGDEDVDRYSFGLGTDYLWRRFVFGLDARWRINNSSAEGEDYTNLIVEASASWAY